MRYLLDIYDAYIDERLPMKHALEENYSLLKLDLDVLMR